MERAEAEKGSAIALDPNTGEVLAAVSWPSYDNNIFSGGVSSASYQALVGDERQPLFPRAWAGMYPSGSTVKIVISVAALAEGVVNANTKILSVGGIGVGPWFFPDWKAGGHGPTNMRAAIAWSINTFYYTVGEGSSPLSVSASTVCRIVPSIRVGSPRDWTSRERQVCAESGMKRKASAGCRRYVQSLHRPRRFVVTPMQVATYTAALAGGYRVEPHFARGRARNEESARGRVRDRDGSPRHARRVTYGSCRALNAMSFPVAGKPEPAVAFERLSRVVHRLRP